MDSNPATLRLEAATEADAPAVGRAIVMAIGEDHAAHLAGPGRTADDARALFTRLALTPGSQYSVENALVARDPSSGEAAGVIVSYPGAGLHAMREHFIRQAEADLGRRFDGPFPDETLPGEYYLDTLAVFPAWRRRGVGRLLLRAAAEKGRALGLPPTLLVDKGNPNARALYLSEGFRPVGERFFAGVLMDVLQRPL